MQLPGRKKAQPAQSQPARKAATGTTYKATGINDPSIVQPQLDAEAGSSQPVVIRELVPELLSPSTRLITYGKMMNDASVDVSMRVAKTPILGATFFVDAYDEQPINKEIAEFVWANLGEGMSAPFLNSLEDILHFFEDGYSVLEKVYELREWTPKGANRNTRQYTMLKKLGVRPASTIKLIEYDNNGGPTKLTQGAIQADRTTVDKPIDITKLLIFTFTRKGGDLTGKSLLRTAYPHWYYKNHFYKIDAVQKERHSLGVPRGKLLPGYNEEDKKILRLLLANMRTNEQSFIIQTPNVEIDFAEVHGQLVNVLESANHHNHMILLNVMGQFMALGLEGSSGGRATGGVQSDIYMKALKYVANYIADVINMYLIPELVVWNYPTKSFPKLKVRNIGETKDLQMLGSALANLISQGAITVDDDTENHIREIFDFPSIIPGSVTRVAPQNPANPVQAVGKQGAAPTPQTTPQKGATKNGKGTGNMGKPVNAP